MKAMQFSDLNRMRCESPAGFNHKLESWSLSDWMTATLGELGEAANIVKKLNRIRDGIKNTKGETEATLRAKLADELADADIYLDLMYQAAGINRADAVCSKFNTTSLDRGCAGLFWLTDLHGMTAVIGGVQKSRVENTSTTTMPASDMAAEVAKNPDNYTTAAAAKLKAEWAKPGGIIPVSDPAEMIHPAPQEFTRAEISADPILRFFHYAHLPEKLRMRSQPFCSLAALMIRTYPRNAERSVALRKLLEAKDAAVRASVE